MKIQFADKVLGAQFSFNDANEIKNSVNLLWDKSTLSTDTDMSISGLLIGADGKLRAATPAEIVDAANLVPLASSGSASDITSGTLSDARLSSFVPLRNVSNIFLEDNTFFKSLTVRADFEPGVALNSGTFGKGKVAFLLSNGLTGGYIGMSATGLDLIPETLLGYRVNVNSALNVVGTGTFSGVVSGAFRASGTGTLTSGNGLEVFMSGTTAFLQNYNRDTLAYQPIRMQGTTLDFIGTSTFTGGVTVTGQSFIAGVRFDPSSLNTIWQSVSGRNLSINTNGGLVILGAGSSTNHLQIDTAGTATFSGNLVPGANATYDIGTSISMRWNRVFSNTLRVGSNGLEIGQNNYSVTLPRAEIGDYLAVGGGVISDRRINLRPASVNGRGIVVVNYVGQVAPAYSVYTDSGVEIASINADGGATFTGLVTANGGITTGLGNVTGGIFNAQGTTRTGYYEWRKNGVRQGYVGYDDGNNISFDNEVGGYFTFFDPIQVGLSGNVLRWSPGWSAIEIRDSSNVNYGRLAVGDLRVTNETGGSFATPGNVRIGLMTQSVAYLAGAITGRTYSNNAGHGDVILSANSAINTGVVDYSNLTDDFVIRGNTGNVEINRGNLRIGGTGGVRLKNSSGILRVRNDADTQFANLEAGAATFNSMVTTVDSGGGTSTINGRYINFPGTDGYITSAGSVVIETGLSVTNSIVDFAGNAWHTGGGSQRFYYALSGTSYWKGHGATPHEWRNGADSVLANLSSTGDFTPLGKLAINGFNTSTFTNAAFQVNGTAVIQGNNSPANTPVLRIFNSGTQTNVTGIEVSVNATGTAGIGIINNGTGNTLVDMYAAASGGDIFTRYRVLGDSIIWNVGLDRTDNTYKVSTGGTTLGTNDRLWIATTGKVTLSHELQLGGNSGPLLKNSSGTLQVRNSADSAFATVQAFSFIASQGDSFLSVNGDKITTQPSGEPWLFLTGANTALGIKVGNLVVSDSYGNTAPTNGLYVKGASTLTGGATISTGLTVNAFVNAGFNQITGGTITAKGTSFTGYYEWERGGVRQAYMGYDAGNDITLTVQSGGAFSVKAAGIKVGSSGPLLKNSSGTLQVRNDADSDFAPIRASMFVGQGDDRLQTLAAGQPWELLTGAGSALGIKVGNLVVSNSYSDVAPTNGLFVKGNMQIVGTLTLAADVWHGNSTNPERLYFATNAGTAYMGYGATPHLWRNNMSTDIMWLSSGGNLTATGRIQVGGSSGPLIKDSSGTLQVRNASDTNFAIVHVNQLRVGANASTVFGIEADNYISTRVSTAIAVGFIATNSLSQWASQVSTGGDWEVMQYAPSVFRRLWVTQGGEVYTQNQVTTASAVGNQSMRIRAIASQTGNLLQFLDVNSVEIGRVTTTANMQLSGHITSAFQSLSADPSTLDISSGMSRLVKNTTSGEIRHWVNDGGVMKKSAAYA